MSCKPWKVLQSIATVENPWIKLVGERLLNDTGRNLNYWRVERADSIVIIPCWNNKILLPRPYYRHGIGDCTYDLPGGRYDPDIPQQEAVFNILNRELGFTQEEILKLNPINKTPWNVDSSFSTQKLLAFEAVIDGDVKISSGSIESMEPVNATGINRLLSRLTCLQCRCALLEWARQKNIH